MKTLPKYFAIKYVPKSRLWGKYVKWLNETYVNKESESYWAFNCDMYYGYDGNTTYSSGTRGNNNLSNFNNNPVELTLKQWDNIVNNTFMLPEKWYIRGSYELNTWQKITMKDKCDLHLNNEELGYYPEHPEKNNLIEWVRGDYPITNRTEITFEQFMQHVYLPMVGGENIGYVAPCTMYHGSIEKGDVLIKIETNEYRKQNETEFYIIPDELVLGWATVVISDDVEFKLESDKIIYISKKGIATGNRVLNINELHGLVEQRKVNGYPVTVINATYKIGCTDVKHSELVEILTIAEEKFGIVKN